MIIDAELGLKYVYNLKEQDITGLVTFDQIPDKIVAILSNG